MNIFKNNIDDLDFKGLTVTIGNFDGVHQGHLEIINSMKKIASKNGSDSLLITFTDHPRRILFPEKETLTLCTLDEKIELLKNSGVENILLLDFTRELSMLSPYDFIEQILIKKIKMKHLVIGYDHAFGKNRAGNIDMMMHCSQKFGFSLTQIQPKLFEGEPVSSTRIRTELTNGNIEKVNTLLGRFYSLEGAVIKGHKRGSKLGFPTANIDYSEHHKVLPSEGVYAVYVSIEGYFLENTSKSKYKGMLNIGRNPTFGTNARTIEVNIFDFNKDIYGDTIKIELVKFLRNELKFNSSNELINQLREDEKLCRSVL